MPKLANHLKLEVYQHDWIPGFAAFHYHATKDGRMIIKNRNAPKHIVLNLGSILGCVRAKEILAKEVPYFVAESLFHEVVHALEEWASVEFSEKRVHKLINEYSKKYDTDKNKERRGKSRERRATR